MTEELAGFLRERPETAVPGERARVARRRLVTAFVLAVALPVATALALLPLRADHAGVIALVLVVPVVVVGALGSVGPAVLAALVAGGAFDVVHTEPYWSFKVDDPDDVVTTIALLVVALAVGVLSSRMVRVRARDASRQQQLRQLLLFARSLESDPSTDALAAEACERLTALLGLKSCRWVPGGEAGGGPVMLRSGAVMGWVTALNPDRAQLPHGLELPAIAGARELGRFVLEPGDGVVVSAEERLTAASVASLFASVTAGGA